MVRKVASFLVYHFMGTARVFALRHRILLRVFFAGLFAAFCGICVMSLPVILWAGVDLLLR